MSHRAFLLLGSNIDAPRNLPDAVDLLRPAGLVNVSMAYETVPIGTRDRGLFLNAAVELATPLTAPDLKRLVCRAVESRLGRRRNPNDRNAPRTIDVDLVLWDDAVLDLADVVVPDPDILRYLHAVRPLADLAPDYIHPTRGLTLAAIAAGLEAATDPAQHPHACPEIGRNLRFRAFPGLLERRG